MQIANLAGNTNLLCYKTLAINSTDQFAQVHRPIYNTGAGYMYTTIPDRRELGTPGTITGGSFFFFRKIHRHSVRCLQIGR